MKARQPVIISQLGFDFAEYVVGTVRVGFLAVFLDELLEEIDQVELILVEVEVD